MGIEELDNVPRPNENDPKGRPVGRNGISRRALLGAAAVPFAAAGANLFAFTEAQAQELSIEQIREKFGTTLQQFKDVVDRTSREGMTVDLQSLINNTINDINEYLRGGEAKEYSNTEFGRYFQDLETARADNTDPWREM